MPEGQLTKVSVVLNILGLMGKVATATGYGTGSGQGMTLGPAQVGRDIVDINHKIPHDTAAQVQALGRRFYAIQADLSRQDETSVLVDRAAVVTGWVDILANNAGVTHRHDTLTFTGSGWDVATGLNLRAVFFLSQAVARQFIRQDDGGKIISIASMLLFQGGIHVPSYTTSKSGVLGLARLLANEWADQHINVNAITPGYMTTNNTQALREGEGRNQATPEHIPAGRWGEPEDLQGPVVFLASITADYTNGHTLAVDGGWLAR